MDDDIEKYSEIIDILRKEINERDSELHLAATYGNELLKEKDKVNKKLNEVQSQVEDLLQEKYLLEKDLASKTHMVTIQASEIETQNKELGSLENKVRTFQKEVAFYKQKSDTLSNVKKDIEATQDLKLENSSLKNKIQILEHQVETLKETVNLSINESVKEDLDVTLFIAKNKELEEAVVELQFELESTKLKESRLENVLKDLEKAVIDKDEELQSYSIKMKHANEVASELQCEIENLKLEQVDVNRKGNSIFAEVDDRRKVVENKYKLLSIKYANMKENYKSIKEELNSCKGQMNILLHMASKKYQDNYIDKLESMLFAARRHIHFLNLKLEISTKIQQQQQNPELVVRRTDKYDYLRIMNQQSENQIQALENEITTLRLNLLNAENSLTESSQQLCKVEGECNDLKIEILKLKEGVKDINLKPDSDALIKMIPKIKTSSGFKPISEDVKKVEMALKGNADTKENAIPGEQMASNKGFAQEKPFKLTNKELLRNCLQSNTQTNRLTPTVINGKKEHIPIVSVTENIPIRFCDDDHRKQGGCNQQ